MEDMQLLQWLPVHPVTKLTDDMQINGRHATVTMAASAYS